MKKKWHKLLVARMVHVSAISRPCFYTLLTGYVLAYVYNFSFLILYSCANYYYI